MKLSATFNFFDGGELLVPALRNIRPHVDHLSVVFQTVSNFGSPISERSALALEEAAAIADQLHHYRPRQGVKAGRNEFRKRRTGTELAQQAGCDHVMFCDVDEFYDGPQLDRAKVFIARNGIQSSSVPYCDYYVRPTWRLLADTEPRVPFICRLTDGTRHKYAGNYPEARVDPTRRIRVEGGLHHAFDAGAIIMHHMTGLRFDMQEKLKNSTNNDNAAAGRFQREMWQAISVAGPGAVQLPSGPAVIAAVPDQFGLSEIFA